jgi:hypothetical protein
LAGQNELFWREAQKGGGPHSLGLNKGLSAAPMFKKLHHYYFKTLLQINNLAGVLICQTSLHQKP